MDELREAVLVLLAEKAPGPDDFIGRFYLSCWDIVSDDFFGDMIALAKHGGSSFGVLNKANTVLLLDAGAIVDLGDLRIQLVVGLFGLICPCNHVMELAITQKQQEH
jgi:hypothetical protein